MHSSPCDAETAKRARIKFLSFNHLKESFAHGRYAAEIGYLVSLDCPEDLHRVEAGMQNHSAAEKQNTNGKRPTVAEIDGGREQGSIVNSQTFLDGVVDAVERIGSVTDQTSFGETVCPLVYHQQEV